MLNRLENKVMLSLSEQCKEKSSALICPLDLIKIVGEEKLNKTLLEKIMDDLYSDGYFDLIYSERHGEKVYCVTLTEKGKGYARNLKVMKRNLIFRLSTTVVFAIVSFIIGLILKAIF
ncbi:MAG: hypothetical protein IJA88_05255 [Clostridia bacterium]|nr:hypothetical protein [Clostridia bacterium]